MKGSLLTYEEVGVVGDVVAEHDETVLAVVNAKLHLGVDSKVLLSLKQLHKKWTSQLQNIIHYYGSRLGGDSCLLLAV